MKELVEYGRTISARVEYLIKELSAEEKINYFRLESFIKLWVASTGGSMDLNEHTDFFNKTNMYALRQIDSVFFRKFGLHIEKNQDQLQMNDDEWVNGIKPISRNGQ
ncbi:hypothetical protein SC171_17190 [Pantoea cypripedii]|uniref:hypothetical protein n=1 Tax=Pantoea cypripedii TaxID=55209 RepID=UPI002FCA0F49